LQNVAEREERIRDLRRQVSELEGQAEDEVVFQEISPRRRPVMLYSTTDGEPIPVPEYMVRAALGATGPDGKPRFVSRKADAPEYKLGDVRCFLHPESPERGILAEIGLSGVVCLSGHLASGHAKRLHAEHRHKHEWAALQEYLNDKKEQRREQRLDKQLEATIGLARKASEGGAVQPARPAMGECDFPGCGKTGLKNVSAHKRGAHQE
jgi:hypothetical protein